MLQDYLMFNRILYFNNKRHKERYTGGNMAAAVGSVGMLYQLLFKGYWNSESVSRPNAFTCFSLTRHKRGQSCFWSGQGP